MSASDPAVSGTRSTRRSARAARCAATRGKTRFKSTTFTAAARNGGFGRLAAIGGIVSLYYPTDDRSLTSSYYAGLATSSRRAVGRRK